MLRMPVQILVLALLALGAVTTLAEEEDTDFPNMDEAQRIVQRYLRLTVAGRHTGGVDLRLGRFEDGRLLITTHMRVEVTRRNDRGNDVFRTEEKSRDLVDAKGRTVRSEKVSTEAGVVTKVHTVYSEKHADVVIEGPGGTYEKRLALPADHGTDYLVFQELKEIHENGQEAHRCYHALDADDQVFEENEMWILERTTYEHDGDKHPAWKIRQKAGDIVMEAIVDDDFTPFEISLMGGLMEASWVNDPPFDVEGGGWSVSAMIAVEGTVPRCLLLEELELRFTMDPPPAADAEALFEDGPYQTVTREPTGYHLVLHHRRPPADFEAETLPVKPADESIARCLEPTPQAQSDHDEIVGMSKRIAKDETDALIVARRIVGWVWANLAKRTGARRAATALEVLRSREGDCTEHASLTVALCRAAGIPSRAVGGLVYLVAGDGKPLAGYHAWAEVWVGCWVPVDATIPEIGTSARYACIDISEPGVPDRGAGYLAALTSKVKLKVIAWKHFGAERVEVVEDPVASDAR